jgi:beta-glucosidase
VEVEQRGRRIEDLVRALTLEEKARLTAGADMWSTAAVERLGIPSFRLTDGPNGARGRSSPDAGEAGSRPQTSVCCPCGAALGATWNAELIQRVGAMLGEEARTKACRVLLAPTVNIHRSPLGGRNFECLSEDPLLAGKLAAAYVRGVQSRGVGTTVKHFVANDSELERNTMSSDVDDRTLREIYLLPFELAVREGGALGVMTAYNRLNEVFCSSHEQLLADILRGEWGFDGFVVTDWFALGSTAAAAQAGLDLEMPGPARFYGYPALAEAVRSGEVDESLVGAAAGRLLAVFDRLGAFQDPPDQEERSVDLPEHRALVREAAAEGMVLLKNDGVLPLDVGRGGKGLSKLAVIGPNADRAHITGGGSARVRPHYEITPLEALRDRLGDQVEVRHEAGCRIDRWTTPLGGPGLTAPDGRPGLLVELYAGHEMAGEVIQRAHPPESTFRLSGGQGLPAAFSARAVGRFTPQESGTHLFTLSQAGRARVLVDGQLLLDGFSSPPPPGHEFFGTGSQELTATAEVRAGQPVELSIEFSNEEAGAVSGVKVGCRRQDPPDLMDRAVALATESDAVVLVVGTSGEWESEGFDRSSMDLPGAQDELISQVLAANPNTVVVVNAGAPVTMDWADQTRAVLQVWFGGQEMSNALVDVLTGAAEAGGRLPTTIPLRLEHNPSFGNFPAEQSHLRYGEGVLVGYRWYEARHLPARFPFGHGLSYTSFVVGPPRLSSHEFTPGERLTIEVPVTNTGGRSGAEVVQCYVAPRAPRVSRPPKELKAFGKISLGPGETGEVRLELDHRSFAYWHPGDPDFGILSRRLAEQHPFRAGAEERPAEAAWVVDAGEYGLHIGRSSVDVAHLVPVTVTASAVIR